MRWTTVVGVAMLTVSSLGLMSLQAASPAPSEPPGESQRAAIFHEAVWQRQMARRAEQAYRMGQFGDEDMRQLADSERRWNAPALGTDWQKAAFSGCGAAVASLRVMMQASAVDETQAASQRTAQLRRLRSQQMACDEALANPGKAFARLFGAPAVAGSAFGPSVVPAAWRQR